MCMHDSYMYAGTNDLCLGFPAENLWNPLYQVLIFIVLGTSYIKVLFFLCHAELKNIYMCSNVHMTCEMNF